MEHAWILEEVSVKYDTWEPFIQYVKFDDPKKQRASRFGYYRASLLPYFRWQAD